MQVGIKKCLEPSSRPSLRKERERFSTESKVSGWILIFLSILLPACEIINPPEEIPAFLRIENFRLTTTAVEGSSSHQITDAWVYVNGELLGAFPLPATVPVLWNGQAELVIDPGIKDNGIDATPEIYPYYQRFSREIDLVAGETLTIQPTTRYKANIVFPMLESFDASLHAMTEDFDENPNTLITISDEEVLEGRGSGRIVLTAENPEILVASWLKFKDLPTNGLTPVYLEIDYKTDVIFELGFRGSNGGDNGAFGFNNGLNPKSEWNKVYLNLTETLSASQLSEYQLALRALYPPEGFEKSEAIILLDNIKLVHRK